MPAATHRQQTQSSLARAAIASPWSAMPAVATQLQMPADKMVLSSAGRQATAGATLAVSQPWVAGTTRMPQAESMTDVSSTTVPQLPSGPIQISAIPAPAPAVTAQSVGPIGPPGPAGPGPAPESDLADQVDTENFPAPPKGLLTGPVGKPLPKPADALPQLSTKGNQIVDSNGNPVRLRGVNLSGFEYSPYGSAELQGSNLASLFSGLAAKGVNVVRVPFNQEWAGWPFYQQELDKVAAMANSSGIYVIFDMHWANTDPSGENQAQVKCLNASMLETWRQLAAHWANQPGILYDVHNEPEGISWKTYAPWAQSAVDNIQAINPDALVLVEGTQWGSDLSQVLKQPLQGKNIVYSVHEYGPSYGPANAGPQLWDQLFGRVAQKLPVLVGEFGGNDADLSYGKQLLDYMDAHGLSWCAWDWGASVPQLEQGGKLTDFGQLVFGDLQAK
ncbi:MAG: cellulase family glycosylhydrolase [Cyanobacteria bacterium REEB65]|nr:cellulase family glycosylhydrolase [Cyanobacteria bacterium REEB65]